MVSESDKNIITSKYSGNTNNDVFNYLRRHYPKKTSSSSFMTHDYISIDGRMTNLYSKKEIVNRIFNDIDFSEKFTNLETSIVRRTIKMYVDFLMMK